MKKEYESPVLEILSFETSDAVMDSPGPCPGFGCPGDGYCPVDSGTCYEYGTSGF